MHVKLLDAVTANITGDVINTYILGKGNLYDKVVISGITNATVLLYGGFTADNLQLIGGGTFTANAATSILSAFPFFRADVASYVGGTITVEVGR